MESKNKLYQKTRIIMQGHIRNLRKEAHLTQAQMGEILQISRRTYANYERGIHAMPAEVLAEIARYFNVSMDLIAGRTEG